MAENNDRRPGNYLSIDDGHSGLPALYIADEINSRHQFDLGTDKEVRPCKVYDLIMGSGLGALDAIFLGRLELTPAEAIEAYLKLEPTLSVGPAKDDKERKRNTKAFEAAFIQVLLDMKLDANAPMLDPDPSKAKTIVCTLCTDDLSTLYSIRSYPSRGAPAPPCTILQAACASVAFPDRFLPVTLGSGHRRVILVDATVGYANPTKELLLEAQEVFGEEAHVSSIVSIGSGKHTASKPAERHEESGMMATLMQVINFVLFLLLLGYGGKDNASQTTPPKIILDQVSRDGEPTHAELQHRLREAFIYYRLNVDQNLAGLTDASRIYSLTQVYMKKPDINGQLNDVVKAIQTRPKGKTLKELNLVTAVEITLRPRPSVVPTFIGREDILEAMRQTHFGDRPSGSNMPAISVLTGLGGSGKTQIALKFALDFEERYHDTPVYFINAESEDSLKIDYESIIRSQGGSHRSDSHQDALTWLATRQNDWCIILDNADDPKVDVFSYMPKGSVGNIIVTTRNWTHRALSPNNSHVVEGLIMPDAITLLLKISEYEVTAENQFLAQQIVHEVEHLPLALAHAGGYIYIHRCLDTYLEMYQKSKAKFLATPQGLPQDYRLSVATTIQMSLDRLPPAARNVMVLFAQLDATSIAQSIVTRASERQFKNLYTDLTEEPLHEETIQHAKMLMSIFCPSGEWVESDFNDIIMPCLQYSLLQCSTQGNNKFHSMHRSVQTYLQVHYSSLRGHLTSQLVVHLLGSAITLGQVYEYLSFNQLLMPHLKLVKGDDVVDASDHDMFGRVLQEQGSALLSVTHFNHCLAMRRKILGPDHPDIVQTMGNLAISYNGLGQYQQALELNEQVLEKQRKTAGPDHPHTVRTMANLAFGYSHLGQHRQALKLNEQVLEKQREILGPDHPHTVFIMGSLASSYIDLGQYQQALKLNKEVLEKQREFLGPDHPDIVRTMGNLATSYSHLGQYQQAVELMEQVLEKKRKTLGPDHPDTVFSMGNLASSYSHLGQHQQALKLKEQVLEKQMEILGPDHPDTVKTMGSLASSYIDLGQYQQALKLDEQVLKKQREILGPDHPDTVRTMGNLAVSYSYLRQYQEALKLSEEVLEKQKEILGPDHPDTVQAIGILASSYSGLGQHQQAFNLIEEMLEKQREILGPDHPATVRTMGNLASAYGHLGLEQQAIELRKQVLEKQRKTLGSDHPHTVQTTVNLASSYSRLGQYQQSIELLEQLPEKELNLLKDKYLHTSGSAPPPLLNGVASCATNTPLTTYGSAETNTLTAPIQMCSNPSSFGAILERHKAVIAFFTSQTCAPCKMVEPTFEELAHAKASPHVAFIKVDMGVGMGGMVAEGLGVRATPTFVLFLDRQKVREIKGANASELRSQVNHLLYDAFPPHPHTKLDLSALRGVSLNPILFKQAPKFEALSNKLLSTIESPSPSSDTHLNDEVIRSQQMIQYLQAKLATPPTASPLDKTLSQRIPEWIATTNRLIKNTSAASLFPLVDLWRLAVLLPDVALVLSSAPVSTSSPILSFLKIATDSLSSPDAKNLILISLRLACNVFSSPPLVRLTLGTSSSASGSSPRDILTSLLISALLSDAPNVRVAAASLAFNISAFLQAPLTESYKKGRTSKEELLKDDILDDLDWEMEILFAVVEGISREDNEDSLHRLVTCLGLLVHLSPHLEDIRSVLEVLQVKETLQGKLDQKGIIQKESVRKLVREIVDYLC